MLKVKLVLHRLGGKWFAFLAIRKVTQTIVNEPAEIGPVLRLQIRVKSRVQNQRIKTRSTFRF